MEKIVIPPSTKPILFFLLFVLMGSTPFFIGTEAVPYWAGTFMYLLAIFALLNLKRITITETEITTSYIFLFKTVTYTRDSITHISIGLLPNTTASAIGLMKQGEIIRINSGMGRPITITSTMEDQYKKIVVFLQDYYGDKIQ